MENAAEALEYAFAVFIFIIALSIAFVMFGQYNSLSDTALGLNDQSIYYNPEDYVVERGRRERIVGIEEIIPTIYGYYKEHYIVKIELNGSADIHSDPNHPDEKLWDLKRDAELGNTGDGRAWANNEETKNAIDKYVKDYLMKYKDRTFIEYYKYTDDTIYEDIVNGVKKYYRSSDNAELIRILDYYDNGVPVYKYRLANYPYTEIYVTDDTTISFFQVTYVLQ